MKKKISLVVSFILVLSIFSRSDYSQTIDTVFYAANWNLENLFDTIDDPNKNDNEFLPGYSKNWNDEKLERKINHLSQVFDFMHNSQGPDLLSVEEVEHERLLWALLEKIKTHKNYNIIYEESLDKRGIDNALIYNKDMFRELDHETIEVHLPSNYPTRYILHCEMLFLYSDTLHIYVNHWPSRSRGQAKSEPNRVAAAKTLKSSLDKLFSVKPNSNVVLVGDFNDEPDNISISYILNTFEYECNFKFEIHPSYLFNMAYKKFADGTGSYMYKGKWDMIDQIIVSGNFIRKGGFYTACNSFEVIKPGFMITPDGRYKDAAIPTYGGKRYIGGYSDHYPVGIEIHYKNLSLNYQ